MAAAYLLQKVVSDIYDKNIFLADAESISHLADNQTVELFYLQARSLIWRGLLEVESDIVFQLAALGLQAAHGDYQARFWLYSNTTSVADPDPVCLSRIRIFSIPDPESKRFPDPHPHQRI